MYSDVSLFIDGAWTKAAGGRSIDIVNPATGDRIGSVAHADRSDLDRALAAAEKGFHTWRKVSAFERSKLMRKAANILRERADAIGSIDDDGAGQAAGGSEGGGAGRRRRHRLVRRGSPPRLWPRDPGPRRGRLSACGQGAGRPRRRLHAVELPDQPGGAQAVRGAGGRLFDHRQGARGDPGLAGGADPSVCGRRGAGGRGEFGVWRAGGDLGIPDPASGHPEDVVHRIDRDRQAACGTGRCAHEAGDDGAWRPRTGDCVRRCRHCDGEQGAGGGQVPQCRAGLRVADPLPGAGKGLQRLRRGLRRACQGGEGRRRAGGRHDHGAAGERAAASPRWRR